MSSTKRKTIRGGLASLLVAVGLGAAAIALRADSAPQYVGVWRQGSDPYYLWVGTDWQGFTDKWEELSDKGLRLVDVEPYREGGAFHFAGIWRGGNGGHFLWRAADWKSFTAKWEELVHKGLRLLDVETFVEGGKRRYLGVWGEGDDGHALWAGVGWPAFTAKWKELSAQGLRLVDVAADREGSGTLYVGVFRAGKGGYALYRASGWTDFTAKWKELSASHLRLVDLERTPAGGGAVEYVGVFGPGDDDHALFSLVGAAFFDKWEELGDKGLRLVDLEIPDVPPAGKPIPQPEGKPIFHSECTKVGPFRHDKQIKGIAYGEDYVASGRTKDSVFQDQDVVKLVGGVCVEKGEVTYTFSYRTSVDRPIIPPVELKAGQCKCFWKREGWPGRLRVKSTVEVKPGTGARYWHKLSVCYTPWRNSCRVQTWEGFK